MQNNVIIVERDLDNYPCPTTEELKTLFESMDWFDKYRVLYELMTLTGPRVSEAVKARVQDFSEDFTLWKYRINKPLVTIKYDQKKNETWTVADYKVRTVQLPDWFAKKLKDYFEINKYSIDAGYLFYNRKHHGPYISPGQARSFLKRKCRKLGLTREWKTVIKMSDSDLPQHNKQIWQAVSLHGFRRFYVSEMFERLVEHGVENALTMIGKLLGHSRPMRTTSVYLSPRAATKHIPKTYDPDFMQKKPKQTKKLNPTQIINK